VLPSRDGICPLCGAPAEGGICGYHLHADHRWAANNRLICALIHRGIAPRRLSLLERAEDVVDLSGG
jgi:hypothetical protein